MNVVCLVGRVIDEPSRTDGRDRIELHVAVSRRLAGGLPQPGVVHLLVAVRAGGLLRPELLRPRTLVAVAGLVEVDEHWEDGVLRARHEIVAESLEVLDGPA
jgi:hypothetical protein